VDDDDDEMLARLLEDGSDEMSLLPQIGSMPYLDLHDFKSMSF
jgi:hypothetical protein